MRIPLLALAALLALAVAAPSAGAAVRLLRVGGRFTQPVHVAGAPGDGERLYVVEQGGTIRVVRNGVVSTFADLSSVVLNSGEQGLLSVAFAPDFQTSRLLYVYFTDRAGDNRVDELRAPSGDAVDPASRRLVLPIAHPRAGNHNGGQLQFGPDGLLYLAPGDGAVGANARDLSSLLGKVLRIDPRGATPSAYTTPADNPYVGRAGARGEVWASGLRNPYRFTFDRGTGDLVIGDVGEGTTEEIDLLPAASGGGRGADLGWNVCEGSFTVGSTTTPCPLTGSILPAIERTQSRDLFRSIIPGYVVRDPSLPSLLGRFVYGDYFVPELRSAALALPRASDDRGTGLSVAELSSFGEDAGGCVYAASRAGAVYRLVENDERVPCAPVPPGVPGGPGGPGPGPGEPGPGGPAPGGPAPGGGSGSGGGAAGGGASDGAGTGTRPGDSRTATRPRPPGLRSRAAASQRALALGGVVVYTRCAVACHVTASGRLRVGSLTLQLRAVTKRARAGDRVRLAPRLTRRARRELRAALRRGGQPQIVVGVRARALDGGIRSQLVRTTVRVRAA